jgi:hypothetical protein
LHQQLTHDASASAAHREPDRDLFLPRRAERQHHVGEVEAGGQQHRGGQALHQHEGRIQLAIVLRAGADAQPAERAGEKVLVLVLDRVSLLVRGGDHLQLLVGLVARQFRLDARDDQ